MTTDIFSNTATADMIDELGNLQAAIKELSDREEKLKAELKKRLEDKVEIQGARYSASKTTFFTDRLDTAKVEKALGDKETMKANGFYKSSPSTRINIKSVAVWAA
jgi:predicted phage-related endonuclease